MSTTTLKEHVDRFCKDTTNLHSQVGKLKDQVDALKIKLKGKTVKAPKVEKAKFPKVLKSVHEHKVNELKKKIEDLKAAHKTMKAPRAPRAPKAPKPIAEPMMPAPSASVPIAAPSLAPMAPGTKGGRTRRRPTMRW
jgi:phage shock protein A